MSAPGTQAARQPSTEFRHLAGAAPVVIFRSPLTDVRGLTDALRQRGIGFREVEMSMAATAQRERFHRLQAVNGWVTLPQVYLDGEFVGGEQELLRRLDADGGPPDAPASLPASPALPRLLGFAGVLPFAAGLAALVGGLNTVWAEWALQATLAYGAVILSFLGGVHWGRLTHGGHRTTPGLAAAWGVTPSLLGWASLALPAAPAVLAQALLFPLVYGVDRRLLGDDQAARGYLALRLPLTVLVTSLLLATWVAARLAGASPQ